ncbi:hypothetical protein SAMN02745823_01098 [Sporobacter termitidis DSM 10068]|uniref:Flagellar operon protein TIGR03826 n=1 Tax=Sporobacter termitidis DSM 10068 TaxID=1123282 RepID=A0A1M5W6Y6_9FIRM|nr:hypothetical protein [Sporobacter termitidis]SHH83235.1 hypothetical protein SAMN02745823_01098 [Sporobacter termitidis DSM 10068]
MPICVCEYCGKAFNNFGVDLCPECSKLIEESYIKARRYIYQNSKTSDFASIIEATGITEKALSYLINKDRILVSNRLNGAHRCRACGKETTGGALCDQCAAKILAEKLTEKNAEARKSAGKKTVVPISYNDD